MSFWKIWIFFQLLNFLGFLAIKNQDLTPDSDSSKSLDHNPDLVNMDLQHLKINLKTKSSILLKKTFLYKRLTNKDTGSEAYLCSVMYLVTFSAKVS
jgi:hypothetical protein